LVERRAKGMEMTLVQGGEESMSWTDPMTMKEDEILDGIEMVRVDDGEVAVEEVGNGRTGETDDARQWLMSKLTRGKALRTVSCAIECSPPNLANPLRFWKAAGTATAIKKRSS
jgi:hypothetical protein